MNADEGQYKIDTSYEEKLLSESPKWETRMNITKKTKKYECCCSCKHNMRKKDGNHIYCECEIDKHYISYMASFDNVCERWMKEDDNKRN